MEPGDEPVPLAPVWARYTDLLVERGEGAYLIDPQGKRYLDFTCGIGVTNTGHCHPTVVAAVQEQAARLLHGQVNIVYHRPLLDLVKGLSPLVPPGLDTFFFSNSGAEAVEGAVKLARYVTGRPVIITLERGFHGRTTGALALTSSKSKYRAHYSPLMAGVHFAPFAYCYRCPLWEGYEKPGQCSSVAFQSPQRVESCDLWCLGKLRELFETQIGPDEVATILAEPVLGEGGYVVPPASFYRGLRQVCDEIGALLIADEVQTGIGRTGKFFAVEHFGVVPDILVMAKGLASGLPLSGIAAPRRLMEKWPPGAHGGTFGGNPVACAAAEATIKVIQQEGLLSNALRQGERLLTGLRALQPSHPVLGDVRGLGLMVGVEFITPKGAPNPERVKQVREACLQRGLVLITCGPQDQVIRFVPPLIVNEEQIAQALEIFEAALIATT
ncbi:MAG: aminotransferase class III-fold pyridoxal phosphate-dependent enzyme [Chloroflexota bacterium]